MVIIDLKNGQQLCVPSLESVTSRDGLLYCATEHDVFAFEPDDVESIYEDGATEAPGLLHRWTIGSVVLLYRALRRRKIARDRQSFLAASSLKARLASLREWEMDGAEMRALMADEDGEIGLAEWERAIAKLPEEAAETEAAASSRTDAERSEAAKQSIDALVQMLNEADAERD